MQTNLYAAYDTKAETFGTPFPLLTDALAQRSFIEAVKHPESEFAKYPDDYKLFRLGTYNDETGMLTSPKAPKEIITARQALQSIRAQQESEE